MHTIWHYVCISLGQRKPMRNLLAFTVILSLAAGCAVAPKSTLEARPPRTSGPSAEPTPPSPKREVVQPYLAPPSAFAGVRAQTQNF